MTAPVSTIAMDETTANESDFISELTDRAIINEIAKLERMIESRHRDISQLNHEIVQFETRRETLLDEQIKRLAAKKRAPRGSVQ